VLPGCCVDDGGGLGIVVHCTPMGVCDRCPPTRRAALGEPRMSLQAWGAEARGARRRRRGEGRGAWFVRSIRNARCRIRSLEFRRRSDPRADLPDARGARLRSAPQHAVEAAGHSSWQRIAALSTGCPRWSSEGRTLPAAALLRTARSFYRCARGQLRLPRDHSGLRTGCLMQHLIWPRHRTEWTRDGPGPTQRSGEKACPAVGAT